MVDLSSAPSTCLLPVDFDRTSYPVRYYFTNLSHAKKLGPPSTPTPFTSTTTTLFRHDVQDCGVIIDQLLVRVSFFLQSFPVHILPDTNRFPALRLNLNLWSKLWPPVDLAQTMRGNCSRLCASLWSRQPSILPSLVKSISL